jgi:polyhydroxyalkanoate synthesis regulator phasin
MSPRRMISTLLVLSTVALAVGATSALAHGFGPGMRGPSGFGAGIPKPPDLLTPAAKSLGVSVDALKKAILDDAKTRIDAIVKAGDLHDDQAADIKDDLAASPERAIGLTTATGVARNLGTTKAKLDDAFRAARKADMVARIDQAVKDNRITADRAKSIKDMLEAVPLPGYKAGFGIGGLRGGFGMGMHGGFGMGMQGGFGMDMGGFGPGKGAPLRGGASLMPA